MSESKAPAIRARLRYANIAEFKAGYSKFVSTGGMFIPVPESKLKPVGSRIRFQFMLKNGDTVLLGKGSVLQVRRPDPNTPNSPVGILVKFSQLSQDSKKIIDKIVSEKESQKVPTQEVVVEDEIEEERTNHPTPAAVAVASDISDDKTVVGTLDDIFRSQSPSTTLDEKTPTPEQVADREPETNLNEVTAAAQSVSEENEPDDLLFAEPQEIPIEKPTSSIRVLSYEDMSVVDNDKVDFGFSGEESEIDDMFDDLFGKSGDSSFFDDVLGGEPAKEPKTPVFSATPEPIVPVDTESELPVFSPLDPPETKAAEPVVETEDPAFALAPIFEEDSEFEFDQEPSLTSNSEPEPFTNLTSPDDSLSMDDAFESEPEEDLFNMEADDELFQDTVEPSNEDENPFRPDPLSIEMDVELAENDIEPIQVKEIDDLLAADSESSVVEFDLEPDASVAEFESGDAFESFDEPEKTNLPPPPAFDHDIRRGGELDGLLGNLENDSPLDRSFDFNHDTDIVTPAAVGEEDSDSLEALLALANKDIISKKEEEQEDVDILDQILGAQDLPPLPDVDNSFKMPTPETTGKKKGLFSKLFDKD